MGDWNPKPLMVEGHAAPSRESGIELIKKHITIAALTAEWIILHSSFGHLIIYNNRNVIRTDSQFYF